MAALQCDICGGSLTMTEGGEVAVCDSCGMKHDKRRVQQKVQEIKGSVKIIGTVEVEGLHSLETLVQNADTLLSMEKYFEAKQIYQKITKDFPRDYRGWWGMLQAHTENFTKFNVFHNPNSEFNYQPKIDEYWKPAFDFAPENEKTRIEMISKQYRERWDEFLSKQRIIRQKRAEIQNIVQRNMSDNEPLSKIDSFPKISMIATIITILYTVMVITMMIRFPDGFQIDGVIALIFLIGLAFSSRFIYYIVSKACASNSKRRLDEEIDPLQDEIRVLESELSELSKDK